MKAITIIGLDPGSRSFGYSVLKCRGNSVEAIDFGSIRPDADELPKRIQFIHESLLEIFSKHKPQIVSIEEIFYHKNVKSAIILAHARAMGLLLAAKFNASISEFSPRKIKLSVTGRGSADKQAVQNMVCRLLNLTKEKMNFDCSDALAIGLCAHYDSLSPLSSSSQKTKTKKWTVDAISRMGLKVRGGT